jgi:uncharacterized protein YlxW (UPF0749 family)
MRKFSSQLTVALVCAILGFMLTYQFRLLSVDDKNLSQSGNNSEFTAEIEQLNKQKGELEKRNNELMSQLKKYEDTAANQNELSKEIKNQLEDYRVLLGIYEVQGQGITIYLSPKNTTFNGDNSQFYLKDEELIYLVNELNFAGAEAISINNKRITSQSGIKSSSNNSYILINDEKISPKNKIEIKAIGDKVKLYSALYFPATLEYENLNFYDIKIDKNDSLKIEKYNKTFRSGYVKTINK